MVRRAIWWTAALLSLAAAPTTLPEFGNVPPPQTRAEPKLRITLTGPELPVLAGAFEDWIVTVRVTAHNDGDRPLAAVQTVGDFWGRRAITYRWSVRLNGREAPPGKALFFCGNTAPLTESHFLTLRPGESCDLKYLLTPDSFFDMTSPGDYQVTLTYDFDPSRWEEMLAPEVAQLMRPLQAMMVRSEPLTVRVVPLPPHLQEARDRVDAAIRARKKARDSLEDLRRRFPKPSEEGREALAEAEARAASAQAVVERAAREYERGRKEYEPQRHRAAGLSSEQP